MGEKHLLSWADSWDNISSDAEKIYSALRRTDSAGKRLFSLTPYPAGGVGIEL